jgi:hypothetical protein
MLAAEEGRGCAELTGKFERFIVWGEGGEGRTYALHAV